MRRVVALYAVLMVAATACGGGGGEATDEEIGAGASQMTMMHDHRDHTGNPTATCEPSGTTLTITASGTKFDKNCLAAPASQPLTLNYDNKDSAAHNIAILESHTATDVLFRADIFQGPRMMTFNVSALRPGTYAFHCEVHPNLMSGTFIVK